ncbi:helix-turn-helix domain-containing protein [Moraxella nasicaprae]|uniref:Helix-turn-helix transcriptional regulator n=1 Tax=Moraxella nasicaprae TaxID=2904122 RepID=A0ABY6F3M5_9GAMM|nr:helix-turn-helix transcriptional regulator [Moraxella nasicaprae]UXZ04680.1 helix-turn-helix transcriptional regulator [Moraxella nasicaprae]
MQTHDKIRQLRELKKITQEEFAEQLAMSPSGYSKIERGESKLNLDKLQKIADLLAVSIVDLLPTEGNIIHHLNGAVNFQGTYHQYTGNNQDEIARLQLIIDHQKELLIQKEKELAIKDEMLALYRTTQSKNSF